MSFRAFLLLLYIRRKNMILKKGVKIIIYLTAVVLGFILVGLGLNLKNNEGKTISGKAVDIFAGSALADHDSGWWGGDDDGDGDGGGDDGVSGATLLKSENSTR
jgi:Na+-transporting NADH:ubiquinone oxidoreductase subunit NqrB